MTVFWLILLAVACFAAGYIVAHVHYSGNCDNCLTVVHDKPEGSAYESLFLSDVSREIAYARKKHPGNAHLLVALMEEVGELSKAYLDGEGLKRVWAEAKQVACVATRIALDGDGDFEGSMAPPVTTFDPNYVDNDSAWPDLPSRARVGGEQ